MTADQPRYILEKRSPVRGSKVKHFRLHDGTDMLLQGSTTGGLLTSETGFGGAGESYEIVAARKAAPKHWHLRDATGSDLAAFSLSHRGRGATVIRDHRLVRELQLRPSDSALRDMAKALLLADTTRLQLILDDEVVGVLATGDSDGPRIRHTVGRLWDQMRGSQSFHPVGTYIQASATWVPDAPMAMALLLFRDQVIDHVRSG